MNHDAYLRVEDWGNFCAWPRPKRQGETGRASPAKVYTAADRPKRVGQKPQGNPRSFPVGVDVRYRPGKGTYGYEDVLEADGRIAAVVVGHTKQRVRIAFGDTRMAVDAASLWRRA